MLNICNINHIQLLVLSLIWELLVFTFTNFLAVCLVLLLCVLAWGVNRGRREAKRQQVHLSGGEGEKEGEAEYIDR